MRKTVQQTNSFKLQSRHFIVIFLLCVTYNLSAQVSINTDGTNPDANSILHVKGDADNNNVLLQTGLDGGVSISPETLIPTHLLHLYNTSSESVLRLEGPTGNFRYGAKLNFGDGDDLVFIQEDLDDKLLLYAEGRTAIMGGNVGIGVDDPDDSSILHVIGDADKNNVFLQTGLDGGVSISPESLIPTHLLHLNSNSTENVLRIEGPTGTYNYGAKLNFGDGDFAFIQEDIDDELKIYARSRTAIMGGNVGIGVDDPDADLEVNGQIKVTGGSPGENKVLTSDANGLASWEEAKDVIDVGPNYGTVVNPATGKTWLDRNLGASQVATSSYDDAAYGDLYQWGRAQEGHEDRNSAIISGTQANTWIADEGTNVWDGKFMIYNGNWLTFYQGDLWTGSSAENNPCPSGFRIPTNAEWNQERRTWSSNDANGAFASPLKLTCGGYRDDNDGELYNVDYEGRYWSSTPVQGSGTVQYARTLIFGYYYSGMNQRKQDYGYSVRCIKN
jgi:uncharacterized protein (TIGR02145 family)